VILYLDASALVKFYVDEEGIGQVRQGMQDSDLIATSEIAYVEVHAALARRYGEGALRPADFRRVVRNLRADWPQCFLITVSSDLVLRAGDIAERYHLRAYDAVHLTSGMAFQSHAGESVTFACWDRTPADAAAKAGLRNLPARV